MTSDGGLWRKADSCLAESTNLSRGETLESALRHKPPALYWNLVPATVRNTQRFTNRGRMAYLRSNRSFFVLWRLSIQCLYQPSIVPAQEAEHALWNLDGVLSDLKHVC